MFTGIITHVGKLKKKEGSIFTFFASSDVIKKLKKGESISVNGCCLTVSSIKKLRSRSWTSQNDVILGTQSEAWRTPESVYQTFYVEIMPETREKTMLGSLEIGDKVNLELPVSANSLLSGHIVQGHIDGVGKIEKMKEEGNSKLLTIFVPKHLSRYIVEKGSITINGISLTVIEAGKDYFTVGIIPHTWKQTMLHQVKVGDFVNIEVDILAKYIEKLINH